MKNVALIIGHNKEQQGAYSKTLDMTEYEYGCLLASALQTIHKEDISYHIFVREFVGKNRYGTEMRNVLDKLDASNIPFDLVLELHFNSWSNEEANGSTGIIYYKNKFTKAILGHIQNQLNKIFGTKIRSMIRVSGYNGVTDDKSVANPKMTNGAYGVVSSKFPYILLEPFFGSNPNEASKYKSYKQVATVIHKSIMGVFDNWQG